MSERRLNKKSKQRREFFLIIDTLYALNGSKAFGREFHPEKKPRNDPLIPRFIVSPAVIIRIVKQPGVDDSHEIGNYFKIIENNRK